MQYSSIMYSMSIVCWRVAQVASILQQVRSVAAEWGGGRQLVQIQREIQWEIQGEIQGDIQGEIQSKTQNTHFCFENKSVSIHVCGDGWPNTNEAKKVNYRAKASQLLSYISLSYLTKTNKHRKEWQRSFSQNLSRVFKSFCSRRMKFECVGGVPVTAVCFRKLGNCFANACLCSDFQKYI